MTTKAPKDVMERVQSWPAEAQEELAESAREMEAGLHCGTHRALMEELAGIDRGLAAADEGRAVSDEAVAAILATPPDQKRAQ